VVKNAVPGTGHTGDAWMYIALAELLIIAALCVQLCARHKRRSERDDVKAKILHEGDIDFKNVIDSSFKAKALYDELKGKCHPDKFATDKELNAKATEIFSLLVKHKHDYAMLCELRDRAINELHINLK